MNIYMIEGLYVSGKEEISCSREEHEEYVIKVKTIGVYICLVIYSSVAFVGCFKFLMQCMSQSVHSKHSS